MNTEKQLAVVEPVGPTPRHWPAPWLEAAMHAGFAHHIGGGEWVFVSDKARDMLAEFGAALQRDERERCAKLCEGSGLAGKTFAEAIRGKGVGGCLAGF